MGLRERLFIVSAYGESLVVIVGLRVLGVGFGGFAGCGNSYGGGGFEERSPELGSAEMSSPISDPSSSHPDRHSRP